LPEEIVFINKFENNGVGRNKLKASYNKYFINNNTSFCNKVSSGAIIIQTGFKSIINKFKFNNIKRKRLGDSKLSGGNNASYRYKRSSIAIILYKKR